MIIDGVGCSSAFDKSGEVLSIEGLDITDFNGGLAPLTFEHRGPNSPGASANDIVGKILFAKKIYKASDCSNDRERMYWDKVKLPLVYFVARTFGEAMHPGAIAIDAIFRDAAKHKEPVYMVRFSIEGLTVSRKGSFLEQCIGKKITATISPCNATCISGVLLDENPPPGFEKYPESTKSQAKSILDGLLDVQKSDSGLIAENPMLLGSFESYISPLVKDDSSSNLDYEPETENNSLQLLRHYIKLAVLEKALTISGSNKGPKEPKGSVTPSVAPSAAPSVAPRVASSAAPSVAPRVASSVASSVAPSVAPSAAPNAPTADLDLTPVRSMQPTPASLATNPAEYSKELSLNHEAHPDVLHSMATDHEDHSILANLSWNQGLHPHTLDHLADRSLKSNKMNGVASGVVWHPTTTNDTLHKLAKHPDPEVAKRAIARLTGRVYKSEEYADTLSKSTTAGGMDASPGSLTGGSALQREMIIKKYSKNQSLAALRDYGKSVTNKSEFAAFLKHRLPDADEDYINHFVEAAHYVTVTLKKSEEYCSQLKFESLVIDLQKSVNQFLDQKSGEIEESDLIPILDFAGQKIVPGYAELGDGRFFHLLYEDAERFVAIPFELNLDWHHEDLVSLPKTEAVKYRVHQQPVTLVNGEPFVFGGTV